ncbi:AaceriAFR522Cp [[Ashbya] aceris (nom. inval.)]|nr:AaceriAFR522Cp [[Ashbya] aceris (nom. inval.)]
MASDMSEFVEQYYDPSYDPGQSLLTYVSKFSNETTLSFNELDDYIKGRVRIGILTGVTIAAAGLLLIILWMVSKRKRTPIFIANQVSLLLTVVHGGLLVQNMLGSFNSATYTMTRFPQHVKRSDVHFYGAGNMLMVLLIASIQASLIIQVHVIFRADNYRRVGFILTMISASLGVSTVAFYLFTAVTSMIDVYNDISKHTNELYFSIATIMMATSVNFMTLILSVKLFLAIRSRRFLGLKQFDAFHILFIMSMQTMICPSVMFILAYATELAGTDTLANIATLLVTLSLPLSSMWATSSNSPIPSSMNTSHYMANDTRSDHSVSTKYVNSTSSQGDYNSGSPYGGYSGRGYNPRQCEGGNANTVIDIEKCQYKHRSSISHIGGRFAFNEDTMETEYLDDSDMQIDSPTTAAEEEAKRFWAEASVIPQISPDLGGCGGNDIPRNIFRTPTSESETVARDSNE